MTCAWFHWRWGSWLEGAGLPAMGGVTRVLGLPLPKAEVPGHPGHPPPPSDAAVNYLFILFTQCKALYYCIKESLQRAADRLNDKGSG